MPNFFRSRFSWINDAINNRGGGSKQAAEAAEQQHRTAASSTTAPAVASCEASSSCSSGPEEPMEVDVEEKYDVDTMSSATVSCSSRRDEGEVAFSCVSADANRSRKSNGKRKRQDRRSAVQLYTATTRTREASSLASDSRKKFRSVSTPRLFTSEQSSDKNDSGTEDRPSKRLRGVHGESVAIYHEEAACSSSSNSDETEGDLVSEIGDEKLPATEVETVLNQDNEPSSCSLFRQARQRGKPTLTGLPDAVLSHCLSFVSSVQDRHALQLTNKQFRRISNAPGMLVNIEVGGDKQTGMHGIISEHDTPETACQKLQPFAEAENSEATYMLGIIKCYTNVDVQGGIGFLKTAAKQGYYRASYALGLVLRDSHPDESAKYMKEAADAAFIPALQEQLPAREMKAKYGEPKADELRKYLDPVCLNRLLSRYYVHSSDLACFNTSHCWNPLCGRWAFKATVNSNGQETRPRPEGRRPRGRRHQERRDDQPRSRRHRERRERDDDRPRAAFAPAASNRSISSRTCTVVRPGMPNLDVRVSRMKMCSRCCRAKYCSKLCQVYDWRSGRHKVECQYL